MDAALDENETELRVLVLSVPLKMLADGYGLLDQMVKIFGKRRRQSLRLQDSQNLVAGDPTNLGNTMPITKHHTNLRGGHALLGELADLLHNIVSRKLEPL